MRQQKNFTSRLWEIYVAVPLLSRCTQKITRRNFLRAVSCAFYGRVRMGQGFWFGARGKAKKTKLSGLHPTSVSRWKTAWFIVIIWFTFASELAMECGITNWFRSRFLLCGSSSEILKLLMSFLAIISSPCTSLETSSTSVEWRNEKLDGAGIIY